MKQHFLTSIFMCLCLFAGINAFAENVEVSGISYNLSTSEENVNTAEVISGTYIGNVAIPASVTYDEITYSVTSIGGSAFSGCTRLTSVTIPASVTSIGKNAFSGCSSLTSITIPAGVTSIGSNAFTNCSSLESINVAEGNTTYSSAGSNAIIRTASGLLMAGCKNTVIPSGVTSIDNGAFMGQTGLTAITIPASVTNIAQDAFSGCTGLTSVTLESSNLVATPMTATTSLKSLFGAQVKTFVIGDAITSIGDYAFYGCSDMTSVTIPTGVTAIGCSAFSGCKKLASVSIPAGLTSIENHTFYRCSSLTSVTIPTSVTSIGKDAFSMCRSLTSIVIPENVDSIANSAFYGCSDLASVTFPDGLKTIGNEAFAYCVSLTSVTLPDGVKELGSYVFYNCTRLTSINIPSGLSTLKDNAFAYCRSLSTISAPSGLTSVSLDALSNTAWYDNQPEGVVYLGNIAYTYKGTMPSNTKIEINPGTTVINESAFFGYTDLYTVYLPESMDSICSTAFGGCYGLTIIRSFAVNPPRIAPDAFGSMSLGSMLLVVPDASIDLYSQHPVWGLFNILTDTEYENIINNPDNPEIAGYGFGGDEDAIRSANMDGLMQTEVYDLSGRRQNATHRGLNIIRMSDGTTRKVIR